jgi:hypothetical protein
MQQQQQQQQQRRRCSLSSDQLLLSSDQLAVYTLISINASRENSCRWHTCKPSSADKQSCCCSGSRPVESTLGAEGEQHSHKHTPQFVSRHKPLGGHHMSQDS